MICFAFNICCALKNKGTFLKTLCGADLFKLSQSRPSLFLKGGIGYQRLFLILSVPLSAPNNIPSDPVVHSKPLSLYTLLISPSSSSPWGVLSLVLASE